MAAGWHVSRSKRACWAPLEDPSRILIGSAVETKIGGPGQQGSRESRFQLQGGKDS